MNRRQFLAHLGSAAAAAAATFGPPHLAFGQEKRKRPNFIFILCDDLAWGDLGCYGHTRIKTPNLARLARQGTLFTQFYVNSAGCSPAAPPS